MTRRRHTPAQIVTVVRQADEMLARGWRIPQVTAELGISEATFHRWRAQYGGIKAEKAQRLRELELENRQLRARVANQELDVLVLRGLLRTLHRSPAGRADLVQTVREGLGISQRRACDLLGEPRSSIRRATDATGPHARPLPAAAGGSPDPPPLPVSPRTIPLVTEGALG